jgi:homogentisate 1,2-dioxygenase
MLALRAVWPSAMQGDRPYPVDHRRYYFVHRGRGVFATEFGSISYEPGDWVLMPKVTTFRQLPEAGDDLLLVIESPLARRLLEDWLHGRIETCSGRRSCGRDFQWPAAPATLGRLTSGIRKRPTTNRLPRIMMTSL